MTKLKLSTTNSPLEFPLIFPISADHNFLFHAAGIGIYPSSQAEGQENTLDRSSVQHRAQAPHTHTHTHTVC